MAQTEKAGTTGKTMTGDELRDALIAAEMAMIEVTADKMNAGEPSWQSHDGLYNAVRMLRYHLREGWLYVSGNPKREAVLDHAIELVDATVGDVGSEVGRRMEATGTWNRLPHDDEESPELEAERTLRQHDPPAEATGGMGAGAPGGTVEAVTEAADYAVKAAIEATKDAIRAARYLNRFAPSPDQDDYDEFLSQVDEITAQWDAAGTAWRAHRDLLAELRRLTGKSNEELSETETGPTVIPGHPLPL